MESEEAYIIRHLLAVEHEAAGLVAHAEAEAAKIVNAAQVKAEEQYRQRAEALSREYEASFAERRQAVIRQERERMDAYKAELASWPQDAERAHAVLESLLFAESAER